MNKKTINILLVSAIILITAIFRVVNSEMHIYHLLPIAALGLFSGSVLNNKFYAYLIPLFAMFISDMGIGLFTNMDGFYGISQVINYGAILLVTLLGTKLTKRSVVNVTGFSLAGSTIFFLLSNLGTFLSGYYGFSFVGFIECYTMALPFYKNEMANTFFANSFVGDLLFSYLSFGIYYLVSYKIGKVQFAK